MDQPSNDDSGLSLDDTQIAAPAPDQQDQASTEAPAENPAPEEGGGNKVIQQLAGKLGQEIRTAQDISSDDIKGAVNSLLAAAKGKLDADAVTDIEKKLNDAVGGGEQPAEAPAEGGDQPLAEVEDEPGLDDGNSFLNDQIIKDAIKFAGLEHELQEYPEGLAFDIAEAIYVYVIDHNDNSSFIQRLHRILQDNHFKARHGMHTYDDLEENSQAIYNALIRMESAILNPKKKPQTLPVKPNTPYPGYDPGKQAGGFHLNEAQKALILKKIQEQENK